MVRALKLPVSFLLVVTLAVATVICCCIGPSAVAQLHKTAMCSHCPAKNSSSGHSTSSTDSCMYRLANAEASYGQIIIAPAPTVFTPIAFFDHHTVMPFLPSLVQAYPRGSPPLATSFTPLYLRTFNLRV